MNNMATEYLSNPLRILPLVLTILLVCWTALVSPFSKYGDNWAIYPALIVLPLTVLVHGWLIIANKPAMPFVAYAATHIPFQFVIWIYCLMKISKDSL
jgi:hypothetical protein